MTVHLAFHIFHDKLVQLPIQFDPHTCIQGCLLLEGEENKSRMKLHSFGQKKNCWLWRRTVPQAGQGRGGQNSSLLVHQSRSCTLGTERNCKTTQGEQDHSECCFFDELLYKLVGTTLSSVALISLLHLSHWSPLAS